MVLGLIGAFVAAVTYGTGTLLQSLGLHALGRLPVGSPLSARVRTAWMYAAGLVLDGAGFLASILALRTLPLFMVESALASSVAVTAGLSVLVIDIHLSRAEVAAVFGVVGGLALMAIGAQDGPSRATGPIAGWLLMAAALATAALLLAGIFDRRKSRAVITLSMTAGFGFGIVGVAARVLPAPAPWWHAFASPALWALFAGGGIAIVGYGFALDRGRITTVAAVTFTVETVVPAAIGLVWLGDEIRTGLWPIAALGFLATLAGCLLLARRAEPELHGVT